MILLGVKRKEKRKKRKERKGKKKINAADLQGHMARYRCWTSRHPTAVPSWHTGCQSWSWLRLLAPPVWAAASAHLHLNTSESMCWIVSTIETTEDCKECMCCKIKHFETPTISSHTVHERLVWYLQGEQLSCRASHGQTRQALSSNRPSCPWGTPFVLGEQCALILTDARG